MDETQLRKLRQTLSRVHAFLHNLTQAQDLRHRQIQIDLLDNPQTQSKLARLRERLRQSLQDIDETLRQSD